MKIFVKAKPNSKVSKVVKIDSDWNEVCVKDPPIKRLANRAIIDLLTEYFNTHKSNIKIIN